MRRRRGQGLEKRERYCKSALPLVEVVLLAISIHPRDGRQTTTISSDSSDDEADEQLETCMCAFSHICSYALSNTLRLLHIITCILTLLPNRWCSVCKYETSVGQEKCAQTNSL